MVMGPWKNGILPFTITAELSQCWIRTHNGCRATTVCTQETAQAQEEQEARRGITKWDRMYAKLLHQVRHLLSLACSPSVFAVRVFSPL